MNKLRLEPTSALVMQWALNLYKNEEAILPFLDQLDMSSGNVLYEKCNAVCNWYAEVILNRKSFIKRLIEQKLLAAKEEYQIVLLAAGIAPMALQILSTCPSKVHRIFEVDVARMDEKSNLYLKLFPQLLEKLKCINADIASPDILDILGRPDCGFHHDLPTIILMEGITYYLQRQELNNIIASFGRRKESIFIIEYLVPYSSVIPARRHIPEKVFNIIRDDCGLDDITSYTKEDLKALFRQNGGDLIDGYSMADMELDRTGTNTYFKRSGDGWIECVVGRTGGR